ncbi:hypothetical protein MNBD_GAMMA08-2449 [hydrothermal vent metagenome]|uniref:BIG2 domain-containing protein n=1 Tax=hydrothermal vent metagenome TaxID=652676 RepID=A0A3B0XCA5_9ZZZZ
MNFKSLYHFIFYGFLLLLTACSDSENETQLVDLFTAANLDLIAIEFSAETTEDVLSINTFFDYKIEGLKSNGVDKIPVDSNIVWSLSEGAISTIDQTGRLTAGSVGEVITITAKLGHLIDTLEVRISAAKFDQVVQLNSTTVQVNMCQAKTIVPIGRYVNDDNTVEIRAVDSSIINSIEWIILNQEDSSASQRAVIKTVNNITDLQALEVGDVIVQARALSVSTGNIVTSADLPQSIDNNLNSLKLCLKSETDLAACTLANTDVVENNIVALQAVANYQASNGSNFNENITELTKWGIDNNNATIALSTDRQQLDVVGVNAGTTTTLSAACGNIEQTVTGTQITNGVVLTTPVGCAAGNLNCVATTETMSVVAATITSLSITANDADLVDNVALVLTVQPAIIALQVTANFANSDSRDVTDDVNVTYNNLSTNVITEVVGTPGEYTVDAAGDAEVAVAFQGQGQVFTVKITVPN